jgi:hypothetical protein
VHVITCKNNTTDNVKQTLFSLSSLAVMQVHVKQGTIKQLKDVRKSTFDEEKFSKLPFQSSLTVLYNVGARTKEE